METKKKKGLSGFKMPHTYVILVTIMVVMLLLTHIIPAGEYDRVQDPVSGKMVVVPGSYHTIDVDAPGFFDLFMALQTGYVDAANIMFLIIFAYGFVYVLTKNGTMDAALGSLVKKVGNRVQLLIPITMLILGFVDWPGVARLVRGNVMEIRNADFVQAARIEGMPGRYILFSEILPDAMAPILVFATSVMAVSILDEAALSFLGMGVQPPQASLGNLLNGAESISVLTGMPWLWVSPGVVIIILVICTNFIGDALRDAVDPSTTA